MVIGLLSIKPILKVMTNGIISKRDAVFTLILIVLYPIFWVAVTLVSVVFAIREFYGED